MPPRKKQTIDTSKEILVIVESPSKAKTIKKYLWTRFEVVASMGHIADLPKWNNAIDVANNFAVTYEVSSDKKAIVSQLKKASKDMEVWIATDEDREWEAIGWHLCKQLKLDPKTTPRIVFREITKDAITKAAANPWTLDLDLVNAQQARRILDRLVWFDLSPVLWKKIKAGLSAWRVQSVAVKILVERETEIQWFESEFDFKIKGLFETVDNHELEAEYSIRAESLDQARGLLSGWSWTVGRKITDIKKTPWKKTPSAPFTTSSLQQEASRKMWLPVSRTMQIAQKLYEGWFITYMRTDSPVLSQQACDAAKDYIIWKFGNDYHEQRNFKPKKAGAQEAHEAIRPTKLDVERAGADEQQKKLYHLIWQRTIASQMSPAKTNKTVLTINSSVGDTWNFLAKWEVVTFEWFLKVYVWASKEKFLPSVVVWQELYSKSIEALQSFGKPPARFTEASLVKKLEDLGIGRPSTYAPTIETIQKRWYVEKWMSEWTARNHIMLRLEDWTIQESNYVQNTWATKWKLVPTDIGMVVTKFLDEHFTDIMDYQFTARVEDEFDTIAEWKLVWYDMLKNFYTPFHKRVLEVDETADRASGERVLWNHPVTWKIVKVRIWRYWPLVQIGEQGEEDIEYASLPHGLHINTVSMQEAMTAFDLPRILGEWNDKPVKANIGRFGPYVQRWSTFASLKQPEDPYSVEYERAVELLEEKMQKDIENTLRTMEIWWKQITIKKWRRGPFFMRWRKKISIKWEQVAELSIEEIEKIIEDKWGKIPKKKEEKKKSVTKKKVVAKKKKAIK